MGVKWNSRKVPICSRGIGETGHPKVLLREKTMKKLLLVASDLIVVSVVQDFVGLT
jgi:hypothetical protein